MPKTIPVVLIIGKQNAGKTTLIKLVVPLLKKKGYRVGTIKYNIPSFEIDYEGKDTYAYYQAGAEVVSISSPEKLAVIKKVHRKSPSIKDIINSYYQSVDVVLVEGYKRWQYPCIEVHSAAKPQPKEFSHEEHEGTKKNLQKKDVFTRQYYNDLTAKAGCKKHANILKVVAVKDDCSGIPDFSWDVLQSITGFIESKMK